MREQCSAMLDTLCQMVQLPSTLSMHPISLRFAILTGRELTLQLLVLKRAQGSRKLVITSYSIHYTKLYQIGITFLSACDERLVSDYTEYKPNVLQADDGAIQYNDFSCYPVVGIVKSEAPVVSLNGVYKFQLDKIEASEGGYFIESNFSIDATTGVISYNNKGEITPGEYQISVEVSTPAGLVIYEDAVNLTVFDVPVSISVNNPTVSVGYLEQENLATVSYTDNSSDGSITAVTYLLEGDVAGFSIDANGIIKKTGEAAQGDNVLSVKAVTNLGIKKFNDVITVTVGAPPTLQFVKADGTTPLTKVTLSPNTAYTTFAPTLVGMNAASWTVLLPEGLASKSSSIRA